MPRKHLQITWLIFAFAIVGCASYDFSTPQASDPIGQLPEGIYPTDYVLTVATDPAAESFSGVVEIEIRLEKPHDQIWLHSRDQTIEAASILFGTLEKRELIAEVTKSTLDDGLIRLNFEDRIPTGPAKLKISYNAPYNQSLAGLYKVTQNEKPYLASQMEPYDARRFVPSFDEPRFKTPWRINVQAPDGQRVITNAPLVEQIELSDGWVEHRFAKTREIPSYLLALAVGAYDERDGNTLPASDLRERSIDFRAFSAEGKSAQLKDVMDVTSSMLDWQEFYFNYPYPYAKLDLIAVPDFAFGAMENAGAIIYRESALLLDGRTSLEDRRYALVVHAHELGHQWFGNLVTPRWWDDIWLNEAFATWISYKTLHALYPTDGFDLETQIRAIGSMNADSLASARQIRNPILRNADIIDAFDGITYRKGGGVLSMFENYLGEEAFRDGIRLHIKRHEDGVADVNDFMQSLSDGSENTSVVESLRSFIFQPGIPYLDVEISCEGDSSGELKLSQTRYAPIGSNIDPTSGHWIIPFTASVGNSGVVLKAKQLLNEKESVIPLENGCPAWVIPNAHGSGYWRFKLEDEDWITLIENFDQLSEGEQLAFADSLGASYNAGDLSEAILFEGLTVVTKSFWGAVAVTLNQIPKYYNAVEHDEGREQFRSFIEATYGDRYSQLDSLSESELSQGEKLLKNDLFSMLLKYGHRDEEHLQLVSVTRSHIGMDTSSNSKVLSSEQTEAGFMAASLQNDLGFYEAAVDFALNNQNQRERRLILETLAKYLPANQALDLIKRVQLDPFHGQETWSVTLAALENEEAQLDVWKAYMTNYENIVSRSPEIRKRMTVFAVGNFCQEELITEAVEFFHSNQDLIPGYERLLKQSEESAKLCAAFRSAKASSLNSILTNNSLH